MLVFRGLVGQGQRLWEKEGSP